jgi:hypothetical protein
MIQTLSNIFVLILFLAQTLVCPAHPISVAKYSKITPLLKTKGKKNFIRALSIRRLGAKKAPGKNVTKKQPWHIHTEHSFFNFGRYRPSAGNLSNFEIARDHLLIRNNSPPNSIDCTCIQFHERAFF